MARRKAGISELPEPLLHDILSKLPMKYVVRMSTLSKRWNHICQTLPYLNFNLEFYLPNYDDWKARRYRKNAYLMKKARQIILSRCQENESANLLKLFWIIPQDNSWENFDLELELEMLMKNVSKTQIRELKVTNYNLDYIEDYPILPSPLILPKLIVQLHLSGLCGLKSLLPASSPVSYLSTLRLFKVGMEDEVVNGLNVTCPFLVSLNLNDCFGLKKLRLTGLPKLKQTVLQSLRTLETIKIEFLPCLVHLIIEEKFGYSYRQVDLDNKLSDSLQHLQFFGDFLTDDLFDEFVSKCRCLHWLYLGGSNALKKASISMDILWDLRIYHAGKLAEVEITAPMLRIFRLQVVVYNKPPTISWKHSKPVQRVTVTIGAYESDWKSFTPNDDMLENWREFFGCLNHARELEFLAPPVFLNWLNRDRSLSPLCSVEHLNFLSSYHGESPRVLQLFKSLILIAPRATTLSITEITRDLKTRNIFAEITIKFLDAGETSSSSSNQSQFLGIESWLQSVSEATVTKFRGKDSELKEVKIFFRQVKHFKPSNLPSHMFIKFPFYTSE